MSSKKPSLSQGLLWPELLAPLVPAMPVIATVGTSLLSSELHPPDSLEEPAKEILQSPCVILYPADQQGVLRLLRVSTLSISETSGL